MNATKQDTLLYVQSMSRELQQMADANRLDFLSYLLNMAYLEASDQIRKNWEETSANVARRSRAA